MQLNQRIVARMLAVCAALSLFASCGGGKTETPGSTNKAPAKPKTSSVEPVAKPASSKPGLKLTTYPNNKFTGPGAQAGEASTIGFPCDTNAYKDKEVSLRYQGYLKIDQDGTYMFQVKSDDQCKLMLGAAVIVDNQKSTMTTEGSVSLKAGFYPIEIDYQNNVGAACLTLNWKSGSPESTWVPIPTAQLLHE